MKTPENGNNPYGYQNKFKIERLDFSNCTLPKDCPIALKSLWTGLSTATLAASGNAHNLFPAFETINQETDFQEEFLNDKKYETTEARAT